MSLNIDLSSPIVLSIVVFLSISWGASYKFYDIALSGLFAVFCFAVEIFAGGKATPQIPPSNRNKSLIQTFFSICGCAAAFVLNNAACSYWALGCGIVSGFLLGSTVVQLIMLSSTSNKDLIRET